MFANINKNSKFLTSAATKTLHNAALTFVSPFYHSKNVAGLINVHTRCVSQLKKQKDGSNSKPIAPVSKKSLRKYNKLRNNFDLMHQQQLSQNLHYQYSTILNSEFYQRALVGQDLEVDDSTDTCLKCGQSLASHYPLSAESKKHKQVCVGCVRLYGKKLNDINFNSVVSSMLVTTATTAQKLPAAEIAGKDIPLEYYYNNKILTDTEMNVPRYIRNIFKTMKLRFKRTHQYVDEDVLPKQSELHELVVKANGRCAISGVQGIWSSTEFPARLSFDHIVPLSKGGKWTIDNLQIVLSCLNQVKGNEINEELRRWLNTGYRKN